MTRISLFALAMLLAPACGKKAPPEPAADVTPAEAAPAAAPAAPAPEPEAAAPAAPEPPKPNADLKIAVARANGASHSGHVVRIERSEDWYAEEGWTDSAAKLTLELEGNGTSVDKKWDEIASIDIKYGAKTDMDCMYESQYTPWMYMCVLRTTTTVKTTDGKTWTAVGRHKWKLTYDDGSTEELWVNKYPVRKQDAEEVGLDTVNPENHALYAELQATLQTEIKNAVTKITVTK